MDCHECCVKEDEKQEAGVFVSYATSGATLRMLRSTLAF